MPRRGNGNDHALRHLRSVSTLDQEPENQLAELRRYAGARGWTVAVPGGSVREAARIWGVSKSTAARWIASGRTMTNPNIGARGTIILGRVTSFALQSLGRVDRISTRDNQMIVSHARDARLGLV